MSKPFTWSYSKIKNYRTCPKRHYHVDIAKDFKEEDSEQLKYGNEVHNAFATRLKTKRPLPKPYAQFERWMTKIEDAPAGGQLLIEQKYGLTADFKATGFFGADVWYRGIADVVRLSGPVGLAVDWKTGKPTEDGVQLALMAQCLFAHYPSLQMVRTEFVWLKEEDCTTREDFHRDDMVRLWNGLLPEVKTLQNAYETSTFPAKPGFLCRKWCPVKTCAHHGT